MKRLLSVLIVIVSLAALGCEADSSFNPFAGCYTICDPGPIGPLPPPTGPLPPPTGPSTPISRYFDVWGSSASDVYVVGSDIQHFDGTAWHAVELGVNIAPLVYGVWGRSGGDVFLTTPRAVWHYDGTAWEWTDVFDCCDVHELRAVWGTATGSAYAVGFTPVRGGRIIRYDGEQWWEESIPAEGGFLHGIWGSSDDDVFAVGDRGQVLHFDGKAWNRHESGTEADLLDVWGSGPTDVFAVGKTTGTGTILHHDGQTWTMALTGGESELFYGIWGASATDVFVVGNGTIRHYDGATWSQPDSAATGFVLSDVWGSSATDVYAVGQTPDAAEGVILRYDGTTWSRVAVR